MTFLMKGSRADLAQVVEEMGEQVPEKGTKLQLSKIILEHTDYEEAMIKELLEQIISERKKKLEGEEKTRSAREHEIKLKELEIQQQQVPNGNQREIISSLRDGLLKYLNIVREQMPRIPEKTDERKWKGGVTFL